MRTLLLVTAAGLALSARADESTQNLGPLSRAISAVVANGATTMTLMPADNDTNRVWASWSDVSAETQTVRLALLQRHGTVVTPVWAKSHTAAYMPTLGNLTGWSYQKHSVLMFRYQLGAAFTHADLYGLDEKGAPTLLSEMEGALIEVFESQGADQLRVYDSADLKGPATCYSWQTPQAKPVSKPCPN